MLSSLLCLALAAPVLAAPLLEDRQACASGVHIIVARASGEQQGEGIIGQIATDVVNRVPGSDSEAVVYPATLNNHQSSGSQGVTAMTNLITQYVASCPNSKIVLMGYSQGAQVVADTLIGSSGFGSTSAGLAQQYRKNIVAAVQMGDPSFVPGVSIDQGTSTRNGILPRSNTANYQSYGYSPKTVSYCDTNDEFCASGNSLQVHLSYVQKYGTAATDFVVGLV